MILSQQASCLNHFSQARFLDSDLYVSLMSGESRHTYIVYPLPKGRDAWRKLDSSVFQQRANQQVAQQKQSSLWQVGKQLVLTTATAIPSFIRLVGIRRR